MELSIIVPIYNVELYLRECLDTLYSLHGIEKEIILVDDGSTDSSPKIIKHYAEKYPDVTVVVSKENGGLSSARNAGIRAATGEYIAFIDSDDFIETDEFALFVKIAKESKLDVAVGNMRYYMNGKISEPLFRSDLVKKSKILRGTKFFNLLFEEQKCFREEVVDDLYRREFILENYLFFKEGILHEDSDFTPRVYLAAKRVQYLDICFYYYRQREGSIMSVVSDRSMDSLETICYGFLDKYYHTDEYGKKALSKLIPSFYKVILYRYFNSGRDYKNKLKKYRGLYRAVKAYKNLNLEELLVFISPSLANRIRRKMGKEIDCQQKTPKF
ncbi:MAG: glycosyltransferase [Cetobacterium sp.]